MGTRESRKQYGKYALAVNQHFCRCFPHREGVMYQEIISDTIRIDINILRPNETEDFYVVYTTGMSDHVMNLPEELTPKEEFERAELMMFMPKEWFPESAGESTLNDMSEKDFWAVHLLKYLARFPEKNNTYLGYGHTVPNGANFEPITDDTTMGGVVLLQLDEKYSVMKCADGAIIKAYMVVPAYKEEILYKREHGMEALDQLFKKNQLPLVTDLHRKNYAI